MLLVSEYTSVVFVPRIKLHLHGLSTVPSAPVSPHLGAWGDSGFCVWLPDLHRPLVFYAARSRGLTRTATCYATSKIKAVGSGKVLFRLQEQQLVLLTG